MYSAACPQKVQFNLWVSLLEFGVGQALNQNVINLVANSNINLFAEVGFQKKTLAAGAPICMCHNAFQLAKNSEGEFLVG